MKMGMCVRAVRLDGLPIQCPGMAKSLATPLTKRPVGGSIVIACQWRMMHYNPKDVVNMVCEITATKHAMSINKIKHLTTIPGTKLATRPVCYYPITGGYLIIMN